MEFLVRRATEFNEPGVFMAFQETSQELTENHSAAQKFWADEPNRDHLDGVTTFKFGEDSSPQDILINELDTIDMHHGIYSANPPYTVLEAIGTSISERLRSKLSQFGFNQFETTPKGFRAVRPAK